MSLATVQQQILRFLASETPEVMSIKGAWGVGKTYAWNRLLSEAKNQDGIALRKYSYVSLFGINSLPDLKSAIFENLVDRSAFGHKPTLNSFKANTHELLKSVGKRSLLLSAGGGSRQRSLIDSLGFLALEKTLICIDDFERKGRAIEAQDILGLITHLKEQKKCKVVLILNDETLNEDSVIDYVKLREKVIDSELCYAPTTDDCVEIALSGRRVGSLLQENVRKLKIRNIRIINRIEQMAAQLVPLLKPFDTEVTVQALGTLTLLTWCYFSNVDEAPDYQFVLTRTGSFSDLDQQQSLTPKEQRWAALLRHYHHFSMDDFDLQIAQLVENGYGNEKALLSEAARLNERIEASRSESSFQLAWDRFNESFDDDARELIECLSASFRDNARYISPTNLDGAVRLLRYLGRDQLASKLIDLYIEKRKEDAWLFNIDPTQPNQLRDSELIDKFRAHLQTLRSRRSLRELCDQILASERECEDEERMLAQAPVEDYVALFKTQKGPDLPRLVDLCLSYAHREDPSHAQQIIAARASEALTYIGRESRLNASRVRRFGVEV